MLTLQDLAVQVSNNINTGIIQFQKLLCRKQIYDNNMILKVIADILASDMFNHQQKQLAATSLKLLFKKRFNDNYQLYIEPTWNQYFQYFINRQSNDQIQWKYLSLTINAVQYLLEQLSGDVGIRSIQKYRQVSFVGKVMLMHGFKDNEEISQANKFMFYSQTFQQFIDEVKQFLKNVHHCAHSQQQQGQYNIDRKQLHMIDVDVLLFEHDVIMVIDQLIRQIGELKIDQGWKNLIDQLSTNENLVYIIKQQMKLSIKKIHNANNNSNNNNNNINTNNNTNNNSNTHRQQFYYSLTSQLITFADNLLTTTTIIINNNHKNNSSIQQQQQKIVEYLVDIKSFTLNIIKNLIKTFSFSSGLEQFDTIQVLSLCQVLTPILIEWLDKNQHIRTIYKQSSLQSKIDTAWNQLLISVLELLGTNCTFIFLMQSLQSLKLPILYSIFTHYLSSTHIELQYLQQDTQQFISLHQHFIQKIPDDKCETPKQACGYLLQNYLKLINNQQIQLIQYLADSLTYHLTKQKSILIKQLQQQQGYRRIPQIQTIYSILTRIYFFTDKSNKYFLDFVYQHFVNRQQVFQYKRIDKVKFLIFIQYCYQQYFQISVDEGSKYIKYAYQSKDQSEILFQTFLNLIQCSFQYGIAQNIWQYLMIELQNTQKRQYLSLIQRFIQSHKNHIGHDKLTNLISIIKQLIKTYVIKNKQHINQSNTSCDILYKYLKIVYTLADDKNLMQQSMHIMGQILQIIDFFNQNQLQHYQFSCQVIKILNYIIDVQQVIPLQFQKYLNMLSKIVYKNTFYGNTLQTYYLILYKGKQTFQQHPQFLQSIKSSIQEKLLSPLNRTPQLIIQSIFLLQNIYLVYPQLIKQNRTLFDATKEIYDEEKKNSNVNSKIVASILLFWMAGQYAFRNYNLGELNNCKIQIFKQQFGLMFSLNLRKLIQKYYQTQSLSYLLKLSIKLLDYEHFYKNDKKYKGPQFTIGIFKKHLLIDSFEEINQAIKFLQLNLSREQLSKSMEIVQNQMGIELVNQLLRKRMFNNKTQRNIVMVKRN